MQPSEPISQSIIEMGPHSLFRAIRVALFQRLQDRQMLFDGAAMARVRCDQPAPAAHQLDLIAQAFENLNEAFAARSPDEKLVEVAAHLAPGVRIVLAHLGLAPEALQLTL